MTSEEIKVVEAMETYGGSFVSALAVCFRRADSTNFNKLKRTFTKYWRQYAKVAEARSDISEKPNSK